MRENLNPRISPSRLICKNEFLIGGMLEGRADSKGAYFRLSFSSKVDIESDNVLHQRS